MDPVTVGGMVLSAFLQVLFDRIASRDVLDFFKARKLDDGLLRKLNLSLLAINKLLDDAEEKQITDKRVKRWLQELQDAVYDAEDLLDAVNTEAMQRKLEKDSQPKKGKFKLKLKVGNILKPSNHSDCKMETKLKEILERLEDIVRQKEVLGLKEGIGIGEKPSKKLPTTSLVNEHTVYGRDEDKESIVNLLLAEDSFDELLGVITIKGMGGIGKTTLAQLIYNDSRVNQHFNFKAWVCVSEEFDVFKVTRTVLEAAIASTSATNNPDLLQVELKKNLADKKFLLVLDDVWNEDQNQWEELKKPLEYGSKGSKILVTTRNEGVAKIMQTAPTYHLKQLSGKDCWTLFAKYAFERGESQAHPSSLEVGREIVKKCKGSPLAAKALGGLLRHKTTTEEWIKIMDSNVWDLKDADCNILPVLRVSYHYLPSHLKRCFAFSSVFPKDYGFEKDQLILLWAAQSLLPETEGGEKMEDIGATFVSGQSCLCMDRDGMQEFPKMARHMSYYRMNLKHFGSLPRTNCLRTLIQLETGKKGGRERGIWRHYLYHEEVPDDLLMKFKLLRVLSLCYYEIHELPESVGSLKHLRYFDLSETAIKRLPDSICNLCNLQTLLLTNCWNLTELPTNMWKLVNLLYLNITGCKLKEMSGNLGKLKGLTRLSIFMVGKGSNGASIRELGALSNLHGELSILKLENVESLADVTEARLKDKKFLEKLKLSWTSNQDGLRKEYNVLEKLQPHKLLKELTVESYGDARFPSWIGHEQYLNITSLTLENCKYCHSMPMLGQLLSLKKLYITGFDGLRKFDSEFYGNSTATKPFKSLEILVIRKMQQWEEWSHCDGEAFLLLQELRIENCPELRRNLPSHLPSLMKLTVKDCPHLAATLPKAPALSYLQLQHSNEMLLDDLPRGLTWLNIFKYDLKSVSERWTQISSLQILVLYKLDSPSLTMLPQVVLSSTLVSITIVDCHNLELPMDRVYASLLNLTIRFSCNSIQSFPLHYFPKLNSLEIRECKNFESFSLPDGTCQEFLSLRRLDITGCPKFFAFPDGSLPFPNLCDFSFQKNNRAKVLPKQLLSFHCLRSLIVKHCPEIESLPVGGLPASLTFLKIYDCDRFVAELLDWGLRGLNSLIRLHISSQCQGMVSFPTEELLPETLSFLCIEGFSNLERLESRGFQRLTSLSELSIWDCPELQCIPLEGLPTSLTSLSIGRCPQLERRLQREQGEDWDKIARIPRIFINDKIVLS